jgi:hypothetical protein
MRGGGGVRDRGVGQIQATLTSTSKYTFFNSSLLFAFTTTFTAAEGPMGGRIMCGTVHHFWEAFKSATTN